MDKNPSIFPSFENPNPKRKQFGDLPYMTHTEFVEASKRLKEEAKGREEPLLYYPNIVRGDSAIETSRWKNSDFPVFTEDYMAYLSSHRRLLDDEPQHATIRGDPPRPYKHSPPKDTISTGTSISYLRSVDEPEHATMRGEPPRPYKHSPPKETISTDTSIDYLRSDELPHVVYDEPEHATMRGEHPQPYKHSPPKETIITDTSIAYLRSHELPPFDDDEPQHATMRGEPPQPYKHSPPKDTISTGTGMSTNRGSIIAAQPLKAENRREKSTQKDHKHKKCSRTL